LISLTAFTLSGGKHLEISLEWTLEAVVDPSHGELTVS
jgi:hypothetical protein